jgi:mRNA-degrading endonuclease RelE of RelBE toxin-antitoxin system
MTDAPFEIQVARAAVRQLRKLADDAVRRRVAKALEREAARLGGTQAGRGGKTVKRLRGRDDSVNRLRVGDLRVMYDVLSEDRVLLVLGVVHRRDLERWLRSR